MKQHEEVFFSVLRTALWKQPLVIPEGFKSWGAVMRMAKTQALTGLVSDVMLTTPEIFDNLPEQARQILQELPLNNMAMHTTLNNTLILVVTRLREHGIEPVLLKGQGVARYYPVPELRQCGDIDLYVGEKNYENAYDALLPIVTEIDEKEMIWHEVKHFHAKVGSVLIEIHRFADVNISPKLNEKYQKYAEEGLSKDLVPIDFGGISVLTPSVTFNVYCVFNHLWHHFLTSGVGLRQVCDFAVLLNSCDVDKPYLKEILTEMRVMEVWQAIGCILVEYIGLPMEKMPFYAPISKRRMSRVLSRIMIEGNFGQSSQFGRKRTGNYLFDKAISFNYHIKRHSSIFLVFPDWALRQIAYTFKAGFRQVFKDLKSRQK